MEAPNDNDEIPSCSTDLLTVREIEAAFSKSDEKKTLMETLKSMRNEHNWYKRTHEFAFKTIKNEGTNENGFEKSVNKISEFGFETMPKPVVSKLKDDVTKYVTQFTKPFTEMCRKALIFGAEKKADEMLKERLEAIDNASSSPKIQYVKRQKILKEKSTQVKPSAKEIQIQTIPGLGNYDVDDFDAIANNDDLELAYADEDDYISDDECGKMPPHEEKALMEKLEKLSKRQEKWEKEYEIAASSENGLVLKEHDPDHYKIILKIRRLAEFELKTFDKKAFEKKYESLPPPEILTFKLKGKFYKLIISSFNEEVYLYLPPPDFFPSNNIWDDEGQAFNEEEIPKKITKLDFSHCNTEPENEDEIIAPQVEEVLMPQKHNDNPEKDDAEGIVVTFFDNNERFTPDRFLTNIVKNLNPLKGDQ